ncbi:MAG TPA: aminotransferase class V-fold PLP-dependent enzyme [Chloroflexota bacterium]|nr:aminotransferase class V-fold PLP-dependent enzyme [Chloroflexota bacterium]
MRDDEHLRHEFLLRDDVVFLNHGSFGACPKPVFEAYQRWQLELERQPVAFFQSRTRLLPEARASLAAYAGCDRDDLVFIPNATTGVSAVARSLPLAEGQEVLATDHEYGACDRAWQLACRRSGARYVKVAVPLPVTSTDEVVDAIWRGVTARTRVLFLSHITSPTALIFPVRELVRRAREAGILTVIDGAHAPGQVELGLEELGADFYAGNCHKWLCAPKGSGFLYVRREHQEMLVPPITSWGHVVEAGKPNAFVDEFEWQGTRDLAPYLAVPAAIEYQRSREWPAVQRRCHRMAAWVRRAILDLYGLEPFAPDSEAFYAQMVAVPLPGCDVQVVKRGLMEEFGVEIPILVWQGRQLVRVSVQGYTSQQELETLVKALEVVLPPTP